MTLVCFWVGLYEIAILWDKNDEFQQFHKGQPNKSAKSQCIVISGALKKKTHSLKIIYNLLFHN